MGCFTLDTTSHKALWQALYSTCKEERVMCILHIIYTPDCFLLLFAFCLSVMHDLICVVTAWHNLISLYYIHVFISKGSSINYSILSIHNIIIIIHYLFKELTSPNQHLTNLELHYLTSRMLCYLDGREAFYLDPKYEDKETMLSNVKWYIKIVLIRLAGIWGRNLHWDTYLLNSSYQITTSDLLHLLWIKLFP